MRGCPLSIELGVRRPEDPSPPVPLSPKRGEGGKEFEAGPLSPKRGEGEKEIEGGPLSLESGRGGGKKLKPTPSPEAGWGGGETRQQMLRHTPTASCGSASVATGWGG